LGLDLFSKIPQKLFLILIVVILISCKEEADNESFNSEVASSGFTTVTTVTYSSLDVGANHACAIGSDSKIKCWGDNSYGQLGDGTTTTRTTPVEVSGISDATAISAGTSHSCAVLSDGSIKCWGSGSNGQLGDGTTNNSNTPVAVSGITTATAVSAGGEHTCAILVDESVKC